MFWDLQDNRLFPADAKAVPFLGALSGAYPDFDAMPPSVLYRTVVDLDEEKVLEHGVAIPGLTLKFPQVDDRQPHIVYGPCAGIDESSGRTTPLTGYCRIDTRQDTIQFWWADNKMFTEELIPVPKQQRSEGTGSWLLRTVHDADREVTSVAILDSEKIEQGPVA
jgi:carotenoid cleavage dioxygenase-like enzyme